MRMHYLNGYKYGDRYKKEDEIIQKFLSDTISSFFGRYSSFNILLFAVIQLFAAI